MKNFFNRVLIKLNMFLITLIYILPNTLLSVYAVQTSAEFGKKLRSLIEEFQTEITIVTSLGVLLSIVIFIYHCVQLNAHAANPQARKQDIIYLCQHGDIRIYVP